MSKYLFSALILALSLTSLVAQEPELTLADIPIEVKEGDVAKDSVFGMRKKVILRGRAEAAVGSLFNDVTVFGVAEGNVSVLAGDVIVDGGVVEGNVVCFGGEVKLENGGEIKGNVFTLFGKRGDPGAFANTTKARVSFSFAVALFLLVLVMLTFYIFPNQVNEAGFELTQDMVRPAIVGIITMTAFFLMTLISFLLMVVGVGIAMFLLLFCGITVVAVFGAVVIIYAIGQTLESRTKEAISAQNGMLLTILILTAAVQVPLLGSLIIAAFLIFGSGIVITTRFGTNKQWFTGRRRFY